jgi:hypothetical protein
MAEIYLVIDESGAKGFAQKSESFQGEVGVMGGYFVRANNIARVRCDFDKIRAEFASEVGGKTHLTDLGADRQQSARSAIFEYLREREMSLVYEGVYVQGLNETTKRANEISERAREGLTFNVRFANRPENERLLSILFESIFIKAAAYAIDHFGEDVTLHIILDRTDKVLLSEFRSRAREFLEVGKPKQHVQRGYDLERREVVTDVVTSHISGPAIDRTLNTLRNFAFDIACEDSGLTFAADVISNSIHHHLVTRATEGTLAKLNSRSAIGGYKLEHQIYGLANECESGSLNDTMYRYPNRKN